MIEWKKKKKIEFDNWLIESAYNPSRKYFDKDIILICIHMIDCFLIVFYFIGLNLVPNKTYLCNEWMMNFI